MKCRYILYVYTFWKNEGKNILATSCSSFSKRDQGERGAAAERRHPAVGAGVQGEALRADPAVQEQQQEGHAAAAAAGREKVVRGD